MVQIVSFDAALEQASGKKILLLGNGFSISLFPNIFTYGSLLDQADFSKLRFAKRMFELARTNDFEEVIRNLDFAYSAAKILAGRRSKSAVFARIAGSIKRYRDGIREALVSTIAKSHPERPMAVSDDQARSCRAFLRNFDRTFSLNYDLLLYWVLMRDDIDDEGIKKGDGFSSYGHDDDDPYVYWEPETSRDVNVQFLHGALHIYDAGSEIYKYTWSRTDRAIIDQIRSALDQDKFPLFVSEGSSEGKVTKIMHNSYLSKCYRSFVAECGPRRKSLFVFGHSLAENDEHIFKKVAQGKIENFFVSIKDGVDCPKKVERRTNRLVERRERFGGPPLNVRFFDADSARVWG